MARKKSFSKEKYEELVLNEVNRLLRTDFRDPRLSRVSLTHVELNDDYSVAKVYWDTFDTHTRGDAKKAIMGIAGKMRSQLASVLEVRHVPVLTFIYNSQFEDELKITGLLSSDPLPSRPNSGKDSSEEE